MKNKFTTLLAAISTSLATWSLLSLVSTANLEIKPATALDNKKIKTFTDEPMVGEITLFAGDFTPTGFAQCNGQTLEISANSLLSTILGYTYGGSGVTFNLPDLRERAPIHPGQASTTGSFTVQRGQFVGNKTLSNITSTQVATAARTGNTADIITAMETTTRSPRIGINYIMAKSGTLPSREVSSGDGFIGEIFLFAGDFAPAGYAFCNGQAIEINANASLYTVLGAGELYGKTGTTFNLPDLRGRIPIHPGTGVDVAPIALGEMGGTNQIPISVNAATAAGRSANVSIIQSPTTGATIPTQELGLGVNYIIRTTGLFPNRD